MTPRPWAWLIALLTASCASTPAKNPEGDKDVAVVRHVDRVMGGTTTATLAGARCEGRKSCTCRVPGNDEEVDGPPEGKKRLEIVMVAQGGTATLDGGLGHFEVSGPQETCFYVDVPAGTTKELAFRAQADKPSAGVAPRLRMAEYGPKGSHWYAIIDVLCQGQSGRCDRQGADAWKERNLRERKRGRLDPCGSTVVTGLAWDASGGQHDRDGGLFKDLSVRFSLEVKKFATQFAPGSTECVPK